MPAIEIKVLNLPEIRRKLRAENLYAGPWAEGMEEIGVLAQHFAVAGAPLGEGPGAGGTIAEMFHKVGGGKIPLSVKVGTRRRRRGFAYPRLLNYSPKHGNMHWLDKAIARAWPSVSRILDRVGERVRKQWEG